MTRDPAEWFRQQREEWLSPSKFRDYYAEQLLPPDSDFQREMWEAVISGKIRVRHKGKIFTKEQAAALARNSWSADPNEHFGLPADIVLSVDDAERMWGKAAGIKSE